MKTLSNLEFNDCQILKNNNDVKNIVEGACDILNACACDCACATPHTVKNRLNIEFDDNIILSNFNNIEGITQVNINADTCDIINACTHDCNCSIIETYNIKSELDFNDSHFLGKNNNAKQNKNIGVNTGACTNQTPCSHDCDCWI